MSNKPKPKKSYMQVCCMPSIPPTEEQRDWIDRHRLDDSPRKPFDPEKLKYYLGDEAGMRPDPDHFGGTRIPTALDDRIHEDWLKLRQHAHRMDEAGQMPRMDPPLTKEEIQRMKDEPLEGWIKYGPKRKKP